MPTAPLLLGHWPCATYPRPEELLSSWLVRLAHDHLVKVQTFGKLVFATPNVWNRDVDKFAPVEMLATLTAHTPTSAAQVFDTTLKSYEGRLYARHNPNGNTPWILPLGVYHRTRRLNGMMFCPQCLREDGEIPYFRKQWRLALAIACPSCEALLEDKCPQCGQPVAFFRAELGRKSILPDRPFTVCHDCQFDWRNTPTVPAPAALVNWQRGCYKVLKEGWQADVPYPHLYFKVLHHFVRMLFGRNQRVMALQHFVVQAVDVEPPPLYFQLPRGKFPFEALPLVLRGYLLQQASWLLEEWPNRFLRLATQCDLTSTPLLRDLKDPPFWYQSVIMDNLYISNVNRKFLPLVHRGGYADYYKVD